MKTMTFDCVEMKRKGQERVLEKISGMTAAQELAFWKKRTESLRRRQAQIRKRKKT